MSVTALSTAARRLRERVQKELGRTRPESKSGPTERAGGWTKIGGGLDALLRQALAEYCDLSGNRPDDMLRVVPGAPRLERATAGQIGRCLSDVSLPRGASTALVELHKDLRSRRSSHVLTVIQLRNNVVHESKEPPAVDSIRVLTGLSAMLARME